jgi:hypothetical protein
VIGKSTQLAHCGMIRNDQDQRDPHQFSCSQISTTNILRMNYHTVRILGSFNNDTVVVQHKEVINDDFEVVLQLCSGGLFLSGAPTENEIFGTISAAV